MSSLLFIHMDVIYQDNLSLENRRVEGGYMSWCLAIIFRQTDQEYSPHCPHQTSNYNTNCYDDIRVCNRSTASCRGMLRGFGQF